MVYKKLFGVPAWRVRSPFEELERMRNRIDAKLNDGVLRLTLPKVAKAAPRRITVKTG